jgi:hypothetical protein
VGPMTLGEAAVLATKAAAAVKLALSDDGIGHGGWMCLYSS